MRMRALPCTQEVFDFVKKHERIYIIEANRDGQMRQILSGIMPEQAHKLRSAAHSDGLPLTARWVKETILAQEKNV
jgi:2-oxoglutarate ferredoxin oxidoreductase subunit alpha